MHVARHVHSKLACVLQYLAGAFRDTSHYTSQFREELIRLENMAPGALRTFWEASQTPRTLNSSCCQCLNLGKIRKQFGGLLEGRRLRRDIAKRTASRWSVVRHFIIRSIDARPLQAPPLIVRNLASRIPNQMGTSAASSTCAPFVPASPVRRLHRLWDRTILTWLSN